MKKTECGVIRDLLPLYLDECCSDVSRNLVEEHLQECEECKKIYVSCKEEVEPEDIQESDTEVAEIKVEYRRLKHWKRRWFAVTVVCVCIAVLIAFFGVNQYRGEGICFTNMGMVVQVHQFTKAIEQGDYEKAYQYFDIEGDYLKLIEGEYQDEIIQKNIAEIREKGFEWYNQVCHDAFIEKMSTLESQGRRITELKRYYIYYITSNNEKWQVGLHGYLDNGQTVKIELSIGEAGIQPYSVDMISPTFNDKVLEILYEGTEVDWKSLLENQDFTFSNEQ